MTEYVGQSKPSLENVVEHYGVKMTRGEKTAAVILSGPFAAVQIGLSTVASRQMAKQAKGK